MKAFEMKKEWFVETSNDNRYVIKFGGEICKLNVEANIVEEEK